MLRITSMTLLKRAKREALLPGTVYGTVAEERRATDPHRGQANTDCPKHLTPKAHIVEAGVAFG